MDIKKIIKIVFPAQWFIDKNWHKWLIAKCSKYGWFAEEAKTNECPLCWEEFMKDERYGAWEVHGEFLEYIREE